MYDGVSVVAFTCRIGSKVLKGLVKERSEAKATYDKAVSRGETAGLLEQLPQASDIFSTRLGNIPAGKKIHVEITYVGELKHDAEADGIRFTIPTHIAPRYGALPNSTLSQGSDRIEKGGISITVDVSMAEDSFIQGIQSPTHPIAVTMGSTSVSSGAQPAMHQASATLSLGSTELEKDFTLLILAKDTGTPKALFETHPTIPNQRAMLLTLVPRFSLPRSNPEIVFVVDRSGSMRTEIPTLISALKVFLRSLPVGIKFNICSFGSRHSFLWQKSQAYSRDAMNEALAHVETFSANYGGTETFAALKATIKNRYKDIPCEVMLLTDGDIWDQNKLFAYLNDEVKKSSSSLRIFALGIGDGVSSALIEGVARAGNGFAQTVNNNEKLDSKVIRMLKGGLSAHTTDYSLEVKYQDADDDEEFEMVEKVTDALKVMLSEENPVGDATTAKAPKVEEEKPISFFDPNTSQSAQENPPSADNNSTDPFAHLPAISVPKIIQTPQVIPSLFPFSRTSVYLLFSGDSAGKIPKSVTLRAKSEHGPLELELPVEALPTKGETIHQLAARKATLELEEGRGWIYEAKDDKGKLVRERFPSRFDEMVQQEAVRVGVQFQVGGKWCSFVAVKDKTESSDVAKPANGDDEMTEHAPADESDNDPEWDFVDQGLQISAPGSYAPPHTQPPMFRGPGRGGRGGLVHFSATGGRGGSAVAGMSRSGALMSRSGGSKASSPPHQKRRTGYHSASQSWSMDNDERYDALGCSRSKPDPKLETDNDRVHAVIDMQDFEGWWESDDDLFGIMGVEDDAEDPRSKVWVTVLVLCWLEMKMGKEKEVWELVAGKARDWLAQEGQGDEVKKAEEEVKGFFH
ncbi:MAG: hypothetical protein Q9222_002443 [Ikaeria aurantiellina]